MGVRVTYACCSCDLSWCEPSLLPLGEWRCFRSPSEARRCRSPCQSPGRSALDHPLSYGWRWAVCAHSSLVPRLCFPYPPHTPGAHVKALYLALLRRGRGTAQASEEGGTVFALAQHPHAPVSERVQMPR